MEKAPPKSLRMTHGQGSRVWSIACSCRCRSIEGEDKGRENKGCREFGRVYRLTTSVMSTKVSSLGKKRRGLATSAVSRGDRRVCLHGIAPGCGNDLNHKNS